MILFFHEKWVNPKTEEEVKIHGSFRKRLNLAVSGTNGTEQMVILDFNPMTPEDMKHLSIFYSIVKNIGIQFVSREKRLADALYVVESNKRGIDIYG